MHVRAHINTCACLCIDCLCIDYYFALRNLTIRFPECQLIAHLLERYSFEKLNDAITSDNVEIRTFYRYPSITDAAHYATKSDALHDSQV